MGYHAPSHAVQRQMPSGQSLSPRNDLEFVSRKHTFVKWAYQLVTGTDKKPLQNDALVRCNEERRN
jgi:hypothetical protein